MDGHAFQHDPTVFTSLLPNQSCWLLSTARSDFLHAKVFLFSISSPSTHSLLISYIPYPTEYLPNQPPTSNQSLTSPSLRPSHPPQIPPTSYSHLPTHNIQSSVPSPHHLHARPDTPSPTLPYPQAPDASLVRNPDGALSPAAPVPVPAAPLSTRIPARPPHPCQPPSSARKSRSLSLARSVGNYCPGIVRLASLRLCSHSARTQARLH